MKSIPLEPHFYTAKMGQVGVYLVFLFFAPKHRLWVLYSRKKSLYIAWASFRDGFILNLYNLVPDNIRVVPKNFEIISDSSSVLQLRRRYTLLKGN